MKKFGGLILLAGFRLGAATVSGQVLDWSERPIYGARVDISAIAPTVAAGAAAGAKAAPVQPFQAAKLTARDGTFSFTVNAGSYRICASVRQDTALNPCIWQKTTPTATVTQVQTLTMKPLVLARGYALTVQLNDAAGALAAETAKKSGNMVLVGLRAADGMFHPMPVRQMDQGLREHVMMVPRDTALQVMVMNQGFAMTDPAGKAVPSGAAAYQFAAVIAGEKKPRVFAFTVAGVAK